MCGVIGVASLSEEVGGSLRAGGHKLIHRSHECIGAVTFDAETSSFHEVRGLGMLPEVLNRESVRQLKGRIGLTHLRWATEGALTEENIHPIRGTFQGRPFFVIHNGEISCRKELEERFPTYYPEVTTDTKLVAALIETSGKSTFEEGLQYALSIVKGTYSLVLLHENTLYAVRDVTGNRPLHLGIKENMVCVASESVALTILCFSSSQMREVEAGEMIVVHGDTLAVTAKAISAPPEMPRLLKICMIELLYSMYPTSIVLGRTVKKIRERAGWELAQRWRPQADIVVGIPDSGLAAATGFAAGSGIPLVVGGLTRYHYSDRIFYTGLGERKDLYRFKFDATEEDLQGKSVVLVDDTLFEGATIQNVIRICLEEGGAREVHVGIPAPMITRPCYYGTPTSSGHRRLLAGVHDGNIKKVRAEISASFGERVRSLAFLTLEEAKQAVVNTAPVLPNYTNITPANFCDACFLGGTRHIPVDVD